MKVFSVVNQKGGCGKTITSVNLSYALSMLGKKVLLIDLDPQAHATFSVGITPQHTIADLMEAYTQKGELDNSLIEKVLIEKTNRFYIIPASIGLASLEQSLSLREDKLDILHHILLMMDLNFDYCIIDCPPNLGVLTLNALVASGYSLVPLGISEFSLKGVENLKNILEFIQNFKKKSPSFYYLLTQYDQRAKFSQKFLHRVRDQLKDNLLTTIIRINIHLREASSLGKTIFEYKPTSRGAQDYKKLAKEIEKVSGEVLWVKFIIKGKNFNGIYVVGDFNNWERLEEYRLKRIAPDSWGINIPLRKGIYRYKFYTQGRWFPDPFNNQQEPDAFGGKNSLLVVK